MRRMGGADIVVAGAGAIGRAVAVALARAGHRVTVVDPLGANASGVAAGMLAPAFECVFDAGSAGHYELLLEAREKLGGSLMRLAISRAEPIAGMSVWRPAMPVTQWAWTKP